MNDWKNILVELAKKLTPPLAFAILFIVVLGQFGGQIPEAYIRLVYIIGLGVPLLWAVVEVVRVARSTTAKKQQTSIGGNVSGSILVQGNRNEIRYIVNNYAKNGSQSQKDELETQLNDYLDWVQESFGSITLRGIEQEGRQVVTLPLETVYVPLQAEASPEEEMLAEMAEGKLRPDREQGRASERIQLNQVLALGKRAILTGGPGCGKTTVLQHIAWTLAQAIKAGDARFAHMRLGVSGLPLPIYVPLSLYAAYRRDLPKNASGKDKSLATFISEYLLQRQMHLTLEPDFLAALLRDGQDVILLLDGLDEVPNEDERARTRQSIEDLTAGRENLRVVVTSRVAAYRGNAMLGRGFRHIRVLPLSFENVRELVVHAYGSIYKRSQAQAREKAEALLADIRKLEEARQARLGENAEAFVDSPLMVRMLLIVHFNNRRLPDQRADLYQKAVDAMLRPDYNLDQGVSDEIEHRLAGSLAMNREMLQYLAYHMHRQGQAQGREIEEEALRRILGQEPTYAPYVDELIAQTRQRGTLLEERGGLYRFIHLSFQEFLAGRYFVEAVRDVETIAAQIENGLAADSWWREPILLTVGYLDLTAPVMAGRLLLRLAGTDDGCDRRDSKMSLDACLSAAELAASAYLECKSQAADLAGKLKARLLNLHQRGRKQKWAPVIMAAAADTLDLLGHQPADLHTFLELKPDGPSSMVHGRIFIAKYPVTNAQYARFLRPENFKDESLWTGFPRFSELGEDDQVKDMGKWGQEGWKWLQDALKNEKELVENGVLYPRYWRDARFGSGRANAPVVGVTWYEANAYCKWLSANWQSQPEAQSLSSFRLQPSSFVFRLPTEPEWIMAAGGKENDRYAFGELKDAKKEIVRYANTDESGIGRTTPVWMYPQGASPSGALDMSGNVWEWQANYSSDSSKYPALRGGSWYYNGGTARVASGNLDYPDHGLNGVGFRVLVSSPPS